MSEEEKMKILATDLDRTLLPNGRWEKDDGAIDLFNRLTKEQGITVVYVTGRNLDLTKKSLHEFGVRPPDILCGDVGTTIREYRDGAWESDGGWADHVVRLAPRWDASALKKAVSGVQGLSEQAREHQNPFKQSYFIDVDKKDTVLKEVHSAVEGKFDEVVVYSFDSQDNKGLLDFLPASATKQTAIEYVAKKLSTPKEEVIFCGDSGNDIFPLTAGFCGVCVRNADEQLVGQVRVAMEKDPSLKVYFAKGDFHGLNGYYTGGVIEGACHYGLLSL